VAYSPERKAAVLAMMLPQGGLSLRHVSREEGIPQSTLRRWRAEAKVKSLLPSDSQSRSDHWTAGDKFAIVIETAAMTEVELGEYCRRRGLYSEQLRAWREACERAIDCEPVALMVTGQDAAEVHECVYQPEDRLAYAEKALAERTTGTMSGDEVKAFADLVERIDAPAEEDRSTSFSGSPLRKNSLKVVWRYALVSIAIAFFGVTGLFGYVLLDLNGKGLLKIPEREPGIMVLASDGSMLALEGAFHGDEVRLNDLPDHVPNAVIAIEDHRFRSHVGFDPIGLLRAALVNYQVGRVVQGGSTITQQLVKNLFLTPDRTMTRKLQEVVLAVWIEVNHTKEEILELYLNRIYFGSGAVGIEKAAQIYFRKPAADLSIAEAAMLAGVLRAPRTYNPLGAGDAAVQRATLVIESMVEVGFISPEEAREAIAKPAEAKEPDNKTMDFQYAVDWVKEEAVRLVPDHDQSIIIETTIDPQLQSAAESSVRTHMTSTGSVMRANQGALVLMDSQGAVRAMVGGRSYQDSQFNRATKAKRQPGSAFKPFVYLAALEQGYGPEWVETDEPVKVGDWEPENYGQRHRGPVTLETAMALSLNTVAVKLITIVGAENVTATAKILGIDSRLTAAPSLALGTSEVTLLELTGSFASFANGGYKVKPFAVRRILTRDGRTLYERTDEPTPRVISPQAVVGINTMLRAVVERGTARKAKFGSFDIAGKTGTSQDYRDAWFIGYTADLVAGVWIGNDDNTATSQITGGSLPADIWREVMSVAHRNLPPKFLPGSADSEEYIAAANAEVAGQEAAFAIAGQEIAGLELADVNQAPQPAVDKKKRKSNQRSGTDLRRVSRSINAAAEQEHARVKRKRNSPTAFERTRRMIEARDVSSDWSRRSLSRRQKATEYRQADNRGKIIRQQKSGNQKCRNRILFSRSCNKTTGRDR
jgi:penicillin-binding protein 1A